MIDDKFKKGIEDIRKTGLKLSEKQAIFDVLENYIEKENPIILKNIPVKSPWYRVTSIFTTRFAYATASLVVVCLIGINAVSAAKKSLPGDALYPLKVSVIEPLKLEMAVGTVAKANVEAENVEERLMEAETLEVNGKLTDSYREDLENRLKKHTDSFSNLISSSEKVESFTEKTINTRIDFEAKINAHSRIFDKLEERSGGSNNENFSKFKTALTKEAKRAKEARQNTEDNILKFENNRTNSNSTTTNQNIFQTKKKNTELIIEKTKKEIQNRRGNSKNKSKISRDILIDTNTSLKEAELLLDDADKDNNSGDNRNAFLNLLDSRRSAKEADTSLRVSQNLDDNNSDNNSGD